MRQSYSYESHCAYCPSVRPSVCLSRAGSHGKHLNSHYSTSFRTELGRRLARVSRDLRETMQYAPFSTSLSGNPQLKFATIEIAPI